jgi:transcription-repair coupling factor (superfamily II helicase)
MRIVFIRDFEKPTDRLEGTRQILRTLVAIAEKKKAA